MARSETVDAGVLHRLSREEAEELSWYREWPCPSGGCLERSWARVSFDRETASLHIVRGHGLNEETEDVLLPAALFPELHALLFAARPEDLSTEDVETVEYDAQHFVRLAIDADGAGQGSRGEIMMELAAERFWLARKLRNLLPEVGA